VPRLRGGIHVWTGVFLGRNRIDNKGGRLQNQKCTGFQNQACTQANRRTEAGGLQPTFAFGRAPARRPCHDERANEPILRQKTTPGCCCPSLLLFLSLTIQLVLTTSLRLVRPLFFQAVALIACPPQPSGSIPPPSPARTLQLRCALPSAHCARRNTVRSTGRDRSCASFYQRHSRSSLVRTRRVLFCHRRHRHRCIRPSSHSTGFCLFRIPAASSWPHGSLSFAPKSRSQVLGDITTGFDTWFWHR